MNEFLRTLVAAGVCALGASGVASAAPPAAPAPSQSERLRSLDWAPFTAAIGRFPAERYAAIDTLVAKATIVDVQGAMKGGALTAEELALYFLSRIRQHDERLRTILELNPSAIDEARASDARRKTGSTLGPLDGIPVSLKDNIETAAPMRTTAGAEILLDHVAPKDAPLVAQLRARGAVILGKANLSEFAGSITSIPLFGGSTAIGGQTINPHGRYPTAGSSSGSAAGVAARLAMVSVGSETSGSLISPSAYNGVVGMKPSLARVDGTGVVPLISYNDSPGPIARTVTDAAALLDAIDTVSVDYVAGLRTDALDGVTVGMLNKDIAANPENTPLLQAASGTLVALGARLRPAALVDTPAWGTQETFLTYLSAGIRHDMLPYVAARSRTVKTPEDLIAYNAADAKRRIPFDQPVLKGLTPLSATMSRADYTALAMKLRQAAREILEGAFRRTGAEVLVSFENTHSPYYATAGFPAITVPLGLRAVGSIIDPLGITNVGMPVGITFIGKPGDDARLLAFAYAFEQATNLRVLPTLK
ncbi:MAG: hypothetical protein IPL06_01975 [Betaproteobacteria bacterium]|nr:hypothetical protein [Betaproteobacteria bacterium]